MSGKNKQGVTRKLKRGHRVASTGPGRMLLTVNGPCVFEVLAGRATLNAVGPDSTDFAHERPGRGLSADRQKALTGALGSE